MTELSKYDAERLEMDRAIAMAKDTERNLKHQVETLQRRLEQSQQEALMSVRADPEKEKATEAEIERLSLTIVELKTGKNQLLQELDENGARIQSLQKELNTARRDCEKVCYRLLSIFLV
jgi:chromosome segregation ATPase